MPNYSDGQWRNSAFCLIAPDCLRRHLGKAVLGRLRDAGCALGGWLPVRIGGSQIDMVAAIQGVGAGKAFHYRALDSLFALGPALAVRLDDTRGRAPEDFYRELSTLKGSTPERSRPGSIRRDLGCVNAVMSLLHISDAPENSARESRAVLGSAAEPAAFLGAAELDGYLDLLISSEPREHRGFDEVLTAVRGRIIAAMWPEVPARGRRLAAELLDSGEFAQPKAGAQVAAELGARAAGDPLVMVLTRSFTPADGPAEIGDAPLLLRLRGCGLDSWEHTVLATSCYFEPVRSPAGAA